jgi:hypothetical protein
MPLDPIGMLQGEPAAVTSREVRVEGILMEVEPMAEDQAKIVRLLDCGLQDYLNPRYAPGAIIRYIPTVENEAKG